MSFKKYSLCKILIDRGAWVAQSLKRPTSTQFMISGSVGSSPASGSVLTAQSLEPASDSVSPSLSASPLLTLCLCLSKINIKIFFFKLEYTGIVASARKDVNRMI